jgi:hypothetical protein
MHALHNQNRTDAEVLAKYFEKHGARAYVVSGILKENGDVGVYLCSSLPKAVARLDDFHSPAFVYLQTLKGEIIPLSELSRHV